MIVYNETYIVDDSVHLEWLEWIKAEHIAQIMGTGLFNSFNILHVLNSPNEGVTYCIQYLTDTVANYHLVEQQLQDLHQILFSRFENKFVQFTTLMQSI